MELSAHVAQTSFSGETRWWRRERSAVLLATIDNASGSEGSLKGLKKYPGLMLVCITTDNAAEMREDLHVNLISLAPTTESRSLLTIFLLVW